MMLPKGADNGLRQSGTTSQRGSWLPDSHRAHWSTREQIQERIAGLQSQIEKHQKVLTILDANKGMEEALAALRKIGI